MASLGMGVDIPMGMDMNMMGMDVDLSTLLDQTQSPNAGPSAPEPTYDARAMDEFFGKMHELGIDTQTRISPDDTSAGAMLGGPTPMLSRGAGGRKEKRKLNNYALKDFRILHTLGTGSFGRVHLG